MRDSLMLAIEQVKSGALTPEKAKAMAALAHQVNTSLDVELRVLIAAKTVPMVSRLASVADAPKSIASGTVERDGSTTRHTIGG